MQRYFIHLSYCGTNYCGWQKQPGDKTVQQTIEEALSKLTRESIQIVGCGRTDTGVHASKYVAHFESESSKILADDFVYHLNCILPYDIAIDRIEPTELHARFDATYREYQYFIQRKKNPFELNSSWLITYPLDTDAMQEAANIMTEYDDFTSFARLHSDNKTNICKLSRVEFEVLDDKIILTIGADRFLRGMIRAIVGTLVDVGRGKLKAQEDIRRIFEAKDRCKASGAAPAQGLFLTDIRY